MQTDNNDNNNNNNNDDNRNMQTDNNDNRGMSIDNNDSNESENKDREESEYSTPGDDIIEADKVINLTENTRLQDIPFNKSDDYLVDLALKKRDLYHVLNKIGWCANVEEQKKYDYHRDENVTDDQLSCGGIRLVFKADGVIMEDRKFYNTQITDWMFATKETEHDRDATIV